MNCIQRNDNELGEVLTMKRFTSLGLGVRQALGKSHLWEKESVAHRVSQSLGESKSNFAFDDLIIIQASNYQP